MVFDVDGTLIESMSADPEIYVASISAILGSVEVRRNLDDYDHVTDRGIIEQLLVDNDLPIELNTIRRIRERFIESLSSHIESAGPFPEIHGASGFLDCLRNSKEHKVAIATGGWKASAALKLETSGIDVSGIPFASCDDSVSRTGIMRAAVSGLGGEFESITYFGDAEWDRRACESLGWAFVPVGPNLGGIRSYDDLDL